MHSWERMFMKQSLRCPGMLAHSESKNPENQTSRIKESPFAGLDIPSTSTSSAIPCITLGDFDI